MWPLTFLHSVERDEEALSGSLVVQVAEAEAEAVVTFELGGSRGSGSMLVPQTVHVHIILGEVLTGHQLGPTRRHLQVSQGHNQWGHNKLEEVGFCIESISTGES